MNRVLMFSIMFMFLIVPFWSCNDEDTEETPSQTAIVMIDHYYTGRRAPNWERIQIPSIYVSADITGNPLPEINFVQVADKQISGPVYFSYGEPIIHFSSYNRIWYDSIPEPKFNPLTIKVNSSIGEIEGSVAVPDTIKTITINFPDTIPLNSSLTISWTGSNADYYILEYFHYWMEGEGYLLGYSRDTMVTGSSVTFGSSLTSKDGDISEIEIFPMNGPFPAPGAKPNMKGKGYGYLYFGNKAMASDKTIAFGKGIDYSIFDFESMVLKTAKTQDVSTIVFEKIKNHLDQ